jgi:SAM-dependent methyltransferase
VLGRVPELVARVAVQVVPSGAAVDSTAMSQLQEWQGSSAATTPTGTSSTRIAHDGFRRCSTASSQSVLEVGCNRGHNLTALDRLGYSAVGVEPGEYARTIARAHGLTVIAGDIYSEPVPGPFRRPRVHVRRPDPCPTGTLTEALEELARTTRRYLLAIEYHSDTDEEIPYRGRERDALAPQLHGACSRPSRLHDRQGRGRAGRLRRCLVRDRREVRVLLDG